MSARMVIYSGLPGSGKSTLAQKTFKNDSNAVIVERDALRAELFGVEYHDDQLFMEKDEKKEKETKVSEVENQRIAEALSNGKTVVSSNTNLNHRSVAPLIREAKKYKATVEHVYVDTPIEECKRRNRQRDRVVPEYIIDRMAKNGIANDGTVKRWVWNERDQRAYNVENDHPAIVELNKRLSSVFPIREGNGVVIVDCDGTLANNHEDAEHFLHFPQKEGKRKNFPGFFRSIERAKVNSEVVSMLQDMRKSHNLNIVLLTGRSQEFGKELARFVERTGAPISRVIAKKQGDFRSSNEFKRDAVRGLQSEGHTIVHALDDREQDLTMFENEGILTSAVDKEGQISTIYYSGKCISCGKTLKIGVIGPKCRKK